MSKFFDWNEERSLEYPSGRSLEILEEIMLTIYHQIISCYQ
ncbi:hypothetical protein [Aulosira sp. FACHB-615]|nr:hypothetical protein [Aulosira sp. FACHB-615]